MKLRDLRLVDGWHRCLLWSENHAHILVVLVSGFGEFWDSFPKNDLPAAVILGVTALIAICGILQNILTTKDDAAAEDKRT